MIWWCSVYCFTANTNIDTLLFVNAGQLYNPQPQFALGGASTGHNVIQHGYAGQLHAPMPPQQGIAIQPHNRGTAPRGTE